MMKNILIIICGLIWTLTQAQQVPNSKGPEKLRSFDYKGIVLTDKFIKPQLDEIKEVLLGIPDDDWLKPYRLRAGKPVPGGNIGGGYNSNWWVVFGQIISAQSRMYAATGNIAYKEKAARLIKGWGECIETDGYFFTDKPFSDHHHPHYDYEKMVGGLVDAFLYTGNKDAIEYLNKITGWAEKNLDRTNIFAFNSVSGSTEWYTLSENLFRAYEATNEIRYYNFAKIWEFNEYWNMFSRNSDIFGRQKEYHAYSSINSLNGAAMAYRVTGEENYLTIIKNAYDFMQKDQVFASGGYGRGEQLQPRNKLIESVSDYDQHFETQCGSWAAFKLSKHLLELSGDARYGDWIEMLFYNGVGASIPTAKDGRVMYFSNYNLCGGKKPSSIVGFAAMEPVHSASPITTTWCISKQNLICL
jgi:DUF1680 family protein